EVNSWMLNGSGIASIKQIERNINGINMDHKIFEIHDDTYNTFWSLGLQLGTTFRWIKFKWETITEQTNDIFITFRKPCVEDHNDYYTLQAGVIDSLFQASILVIDFSDCIYIPFAIESFQFHRNYSKDLPLNVHITKISVTKEIATINIDAFSDKELIVQVKNIKMKRAQKGSLLSSINKISSKSNIQTNHYTVNWNKKENKNLKLRLINGHWIVILKR